MKWTAILNKKILLNFVNKEERFDNGVCVFMDLLPSVKANLSNTI